MPRPMKPANQATDSRKLTKPTSKRGNGASNSVSDEDVARRAYEIYQSRGGMHGADLDDWLEAERQLKPGPSSVTGPRPTSRKRKASEERASNGRAGAPGNSRSRRQARSPE